MILYFNAAITRLVAAVLYHIDIGSEGLKKAGIEIIQAQICA